MGTAASSIPVLRLRDLLDFGHAANVACIVHLGERALGKTGICANKLGVHACGVGGVVKKKNETLIRCHGRVPCWSLQSAAGAHRANIFQNASQHRSIVAHQTQHSHGHALILLRHLGRHPGSNTASVRPTGPGAESFRRKQHGTQTRGRLRSASAAVCRCRRQPQLTESRATSKSAGLSTTRSSIRFSTA